MTEHVFSLEGRTAVITGGTTGLGLAIAECMVKAGARVAVLSRRTKEEGQSALKEMGEKAAELMVNRIENPKAEYKRIILEPTLIVRNSTMAYSENS